MKKLRKASDPTATEPLARAVRSFLTTLGPSPSEVASSVSHLGFTGETGVDPIRCVLSSLLGAEPGVRRLRMTRGHLLITRRSFPPLLLVRLPVPVLVFSDAYRAGCYSQLVSSASVGDPTAPLESRRRDTGE